MNERMVESTTNIGFKPEHVGSYGVLPLYENKWSIFMELLLLDAMEMYTWVDLDLDPRIGP